MHSIDGISPCLSAQMGGTANGSILIAELGDVAEFKEEHDDESTSEI